MNIPLIAARNMIIIKSDKTLFVRIDINNAAEIIPIAIIFMYSAMKIRAKVPDLYSVLNPETSSDSPSARSKGVRLVSAKDVMIQVMNRGQSIIKNVIEFIFAKLLNLREDSMIIGVNITRAILTSYEMVCAILRSAPNREYLLLDAHPENKVV